MHVKREEAEPLPPTPSSVAVSFQGESAAGDPNNHVRRLQQLLRDQEVSFAQQRQEKIEYMARLDELERRLKRNEGVNLDYLKNVVAKYMEGDGDEALFKVITTMLQFSPDEINRIRSRRSERSGLLGNFRLF